MYVYYCSSGRLERLVEAHPDVQIYVGHVDRRVAERERIYSAWSGDAGDRIFGAKNKNQNKYNKSGWCIFGERVFGNTIQLAVQ